MAQSQLMWRVKILEKEDSLITQTPPQLQLMIH